MSGGPVRTSTAMRGDLDGSQLARAKETLQILRDKSVQNCSLSKGATGLGNWSRALPQAARRASAKKGFDCRNLLWPGQVSSVPSSGATTSQQQKIPAPWPQGRDFYYATHTHSARALRGLGKRGIKRLAPTTVSRTPFHICTKQLTPQLRRTVGISDHQAMSYSLCNFRTAAPNAFSTTDSARPISASQLGSPSLRRNSIFVAINLASPRNSCAVRSMR